MVNATVTKLNGLYSICYGLGGLIFPWEEEIYETKSVSFLFLSTIGHLEKMWSSLDQILTSIENCVDMNGILTLPLKSENSGQPE